MRVSAGLLPRSLQNQNFQNLFATSRAKGGKVKFYPLPKKKINKLNLEIVEQPLSPPSILPEKSLFSPSPSPRPLPGL